jgi:hypothetical protein
VRQWTHETGQFGQVKGKNEKDKNENESQTMISRWKPAESEQIMEYNGSIGIPNIFVLNADGQYHLNEQSI